ncbi:MAG: YihY/virulence factor BrkB family protein [Tissierellia bacterium]|nr:YihY/virulence factor BrkB family protein [Tissierellia bacterium]
MDWKKRLLKYSNSKWFIFLDNLIYNIRNDEVTAIGAQLTYYLILSIFPFLIFFLNVLGHTSLAVESLLENWIIALPTQTQTLLYKVIDEISLASSDTLLSLSIVLALWSASLGISAIIRAINKAYNIKRKRNYIRLKLLSLLFTLALVILLMIVLVTLVFGELIGNTIFTYIGAVNVFYRIWDRSRKMIALLSMIIIFALLYKYSIEPKERRHIRLVHTLPGAIFATIGWILASGAFSYYVNNFANYSKTYGSLGAVIILLVWLYITSIMIVLGGEINGTYASLFILNRKDTGDRE